MHSVGQAVTEKPRKDPRISKELLPAGPVLLLSTLVTRGCGFHFDFKVAPNLTATLGAARGKTMTFPRRFLYSQLSPQQTLGKAAQEHPQRSNIAREGVPALAMDHPQTWLQGWRDGLHLQCRDIPVLEGLTRERESDSLHGHTVIEQGGRF